MVRWLKLETAFPRALGKSFDPAVVEVPAPVEDDLGYSGGEGLGGLFDGAEGFGEACGGGGCDVAQVCACEFGGSLGVAAGVGVLGGRLLLR